MNLDSIEYEGMFARNFTTLSRIELEVVLSYRNHPDIRKWMYNSEIIPLENHLNYVKSLKTRTDQYYWLVESIENGQHLGVIYIKDLDFDKKEGWYGIFGNPNNRIKGVGTMLSKIELFILFDLLGMTTVLLSVKSDNIPAIKLYEKLGFEQDYVDQNDYIFMHLKLENYVYRK